MPNSTAWTNNYIRIPFILRGRSHEGADCWGIIRLVLEEQFGIVVPSYDELDYENIKDTRKRWKILSEVILKGRDDTKNGWLQIIPGTEKPGDILLIRQSGHYVHVGIVVIPNMMLHSEEGVGCVVENYAGLNWQRRVIGIYRNVGMCTQ